MSHDEHFSTDYARGQHRPISAVHALSDAADSDGEQSMSRGRRKPVGGPPRYQMIAFDLEQEIVSGRYRLGDMLPTEADLVERFGVSRFTVREALRQLERFGLVRRRRGSGTFVQSSIPMEQFTQRLQSLDDLLQYAPSTLHVDTISKVRLTRAEADLLAAPHGETWLRAEGVRRAIGSGVPLCAATVWLRPEFSGVVSAGCVIQGAVHTRLENVCGVRIERVDVHLDCHMLTSVECRQHGVGTPVPVMRMARRFSDSRNRTLQVSRDALLADRFSYRAQYQRDGGP